ncbi:hypothetical protein CBL_03360 [Carabus blaptoides fortunei]
MDNSMTDTDDGMAERVFRVNSLKTDGVAGALKRCREAGMGMLLPGIRHKFISIFLESDIWPEKTSVSPSPSVVLPSSSHPPLTERLYSFAESPGDITLDIVGSDEDMKTASRYIYREISQI